MRRGCQAQTQKGAVRIHAGPAPSNLVKCFSAGLDTRQKGSRVPDANATDPSWPTQYCVQYSTVQYVPDHAAAGAFFGTSDRRLRLRLPTADPPIPHLLTATWSLMHILATHSHLPPAERRHAPACPGRAACRPVP